MTGTSKARDNRAFVLANTQLSSPTLLPELKLHLAHQSLALWQKTIDDMDELGLEPPYWAFAWAGGQALARYVLDHPECVAGRRVVDFGAGSGIVAIAAALSGAREVVAIDIDPLALAAIELNASANGAGVNIYGDDLLGGAKPILADTLFLGDMFYEADMARRMLLLAERGKADGARVLVGDPERSYFPRARFEVVASYEVPVSQDIEDADVKKSRVWRFT